MTTPVLPGMFDAPLAPSSATMAPAAVQARRSGRATQTGQRQPTRSMLAYRDALRRVQPATDHAVAEAAGLPLASVNGRRNDWLAMDPVCIDAVDRVPALWNGIGSRTRWRIRPGSMADTAEAP